MPFTEKDITGSVVRAMREKLGLSQSAFWQAVGVEQSVGCRYESDKRIPRPVRILIVAHYVSGVKINAATHEGVQELARLGSMQQSKKAIHDIRKSIKSAAERLEHAAERLTNL